MKNEDTIENEMAGLKNKIDAVDVLLGSMDPENTNMAEKTYLTDQIYHMRCYYDCLSLRLNMVSN